MSEGMFKSQIRPSQVNALLEKVSKRNYGRYLVKLTMAKLRGFTDQTVTFDFPVTALVGPNGGGKTTILGAAACAYLAVKPRQFFAKSGKFDSSMANWRVEYDLIDRSVNKTDSFRRTAAFHSQKWSRSAETREVLVFGVARTVPANERKELQKCASGSFSVDASWVQGLHASVVRAVQKILGKDISGYSHIRADEQGRVSMLAGQTDQKTPYSEFHFGAGESSIIRMVMRIESIEENGLILIEEIENGLHPVATVRMVEYLIDVAERKNAQAIFTTHSDDALMPLPAQAIWASLSGRVFQGKLDITALRAIVGQIDAKLAIFCEDRFAAAWIRAILRHRGGLALDAIEVHPMLGDGIAVDVSRHHNKDPSTPFPSVCIIDGDSHQQTSAEDRVFRLPGQSPEAHVFDTILECASKAAGVLTVRLLQPFSMSDRVISILGEIRGTNRDPHLLYSQVGQALGLIPESTVVEAFVNTWAEFYPDEGKASLGPFEGLLPIESGAPAQPAAAAAPAQPAAAAAPAQPKEV
jgi:predicted ATPase